jgi:hypothetical protein
VIALALVVLDMFTDRASQVRFPDRDNLRQTLRLDRSNEPLGVGVQVRTAARKPHGAHPGRLERFSERFREQRIAIVNEMAAPKQEPVFAVRPIPGDLMHPASMVAAREEPQVRSFYHKRIAGGLKPIQALVAVERKLLHSIHGMWSSNRDFDGEKFCARSA